MKRHGPWVIKKSQVVYKDPWIEVKKDTVIRPDKKDHVFGTVEMRHGSSVLPIDGSGNVYLVRLFRYSLGKDSIETVSGAIKQGETPKSAASRELKEELGIRARSLVSLGLVNPFTNLIKSPTYLFLARNLSFGKPSLDKTEKMERMEKVKIPFAEAVDMVMKSRIHHAQSAVLIMKAKEYLKK